MRRITCFISVVLGGCTAGKPTAVTADTSTEPTTETNVQVLDAAGTLFGNASERVGHDLAFLEDGQLIIGAPSYPHGHEPGDASDDEVWVIPGGEGLVPEDVAATGINDPWDDGFTGQNGAGNQFGYRVVAPGDVTGDGVPDVAISDDPTKTSGPPPEAYWSIHPGPDFSTGLRLSFPSAGRAAPCGDLDGDGISELCTANGVVFGPIVQDADRELSWNASDPSVTAADLDGDGVSELLLSDSAANAVYHLASLTRAGQVVLADIAADTWTAQNGGATALAAGDLDGDGTDEVIAGWSGSGDDVVLVGLSPGGGDVFAAARSTLPVRAEELAVGDFDGDGQDDLAVGGASEVTLWLGPIEPGTRLIEEAAARYRGLEFPSDQFGSALAVADTDGDARSDLAIGAPLEDYAQDSCLPQNGSCPASGRVWWLSGGGL